MGAVKGTIYILVGCVLNVVTLEMITKRDKGAGHLITFTQFLCVTLSTIGSVWIFPFGGLKPRKTPLAYYSLLTAVFWASSVTNNKALQYDISVPLHTIFRSSTLVSSLVIGLTLFGKRYSWGKILSSIIVTLGVCVATLAEARTKQGSNALTTSGCCDGVPAETRLAHKAASDASSLIIGVALLTVALVLTALLGHLQEKAYRTYGRDSWQENMFYSHFLALPGFLFVFSEIKEHAFLWWQGAFPPVTVSIGLPFTAEPALSFSLPLFAVLLANGLLQVVCIRGVFMLTSSTSTLTCTLVMTLRKFISLVLSIIFFGNPFTAAHWAGAVLVFVGLLLEKLWPEKHKQKQS